MNKKIFVVLIILIVYFSLTTITHAQDQSMLLVNDVIKKCQIQLIDNKVEPSRWWHSPLTYVNSDNYLSYCQSLGYSFQQTVAKPIFILPYIIFWIIFFGSMYLYYKFIFHVKRKYNIILFITFVSLTFLFLSHIYPFIIDLLGSPENLRIFLNGLINY